MKAIVYEEYGPPDVMQVKEVEKPAPKLGEVLVKVLASSINYSDLAFVTGKPFMIRMMAGGISKPKYPILGKDIAGQVESLGEGAKTFQVGDDVFGDLSECGFGAFGEYVAVPESALAPKPSNLTYEETAAVPEAAVVALQGLRDLGLVKSGQSVLINGASGGIGTYAVQIAKAFGAVVTGVCSTKNLELVQSIGADHVVDYTREDFSKNGRRYDLILATAGYRSLFDYKRALKPDGTYVVTGGSMAQIFQPMLLGAFITMGSSQKMVNLSMKPKRDDLLAVKELIEAGKVTPVIDRTYPLNQVAEAIRYYGKGHARGKVVISHTGA